MFPSSRKWLLYHVIIFCEYKGGLSDKIRLKYLFNIIERGMCYPICGKEGNVLFNNVLNTFYLRLCGIIHMVKDHFEKGNPLPPHRLLFTINSKGSFICTIPQTG